MLTKRKRHDHDNLAGQPQRASQAQADDKELADTIPPLYANDGADDPDAVVARVKLFSPCAPRDAA